MQPSILKRASLPLTAAVLVVGAAVGAGAPNLDRAEPVAAVRPAEVRADAAPATTDTSIESGTTETTVTDTTAADAAAEAAAAQAKADEDARVLDYYHQLEDQAAYYEAAQEQAYYAALEQQAADAAAAAERPAGVPDDSYWDRIATCETGGNWSMSGSRYSGGVGFANTTWNSWGGREFADNAGSATREQQIVVANRVATQGYGSVAPVGYSGWGCARHSVGYP